MAEFVGRRLDSAMVYRMASAGSSLVPSKRTSRGTTRSDRDQEVSADRVELGEHIQELSTLDRLSSLKRLYIHCSQSADAAKRGGGRSGK